MLKAVTIVLLAVAAVSFCHEFDDEVPLDQRNVNFNEYYLYTRPFTGIPIKMTEDNMNILNDRNLVVVIHGHQGSYRSVMNTQIAEGILGKAGEDVNVLILDWSVQAGYSYSNADASLSVVSSYLANFLDRPNLEKEHMHIIGFDLGAHIAGQTGRIFNYAGTPVARITGLDPTKSRNKLAPTDATYVEVIHTNGGLLGTGLDEQLGDADFYPNGGKGQPGCLVNSCCHNRAWQLFSVSLDPIHTFTAKCCKSMTQMKLNACSGVPQDMGNNKLVKLIGGCTSGIYRVNTKASPPY